MSAITTHVLDTARGGPAAGVRVELERGDGTSWQAVGHGHTDSDGRLRTLMGESVPLQPGTYRLTFATADYFAAAGLASFYPRIVVEFVVAAGERHYHVPILLSPFGYSTYRGT